MDQETQYLSALENAAVYQINGSRLEIRDANGMKDAQIVPGQTIPAVTGVVPVAVSFTKGGYPGQELVERMDSRGADAPLSLRIVDVDAGTAVGDPLVVAGAEVGSITSVSPAGTLALALVRRGHEVGRPPAHLAVE